ncbi:hypothetical protein VTK73DRAFT_4275 [Phialemonium thermophilum]|uniref:Uncharacterized protein n=1 Tax=Phialemonium thermophilum TaxID=223376 RepID=A0ABR3V9X3_9PEZI
MKSTSSLSLASAVLLSLSQWVSCNSMVFPRNNILLFESISNRTKVPLGQLSDGLAGRELPGGLEERQSSQCVDPGYAVPCSNVPDSCCPSGYACFPDGCCNQARGRLVPCPNGKYCYLASSEICCDGGTCPDADTCCDNECCRSIAYCGSDGYCSACPDATVTRTTTWTYTSTLRVARL